MTLEINIKHIHKTEIIYSAGLQLIINGITDFILDITFVLDITYIYTERKKKRRVNFIPKFHSSLKKFVKYFTMITKRYMYGTKVPNFIGL